MFFQFLCGFHRFSSVFSGFSSKKHVFFPHPEPRQDMADTFPAGFQKTISGALEGNSNRKIKKTSTDLTRQEEQIAEAIFPFTTAN